jgi:hypothetical protein
LTVAAGVLAVALLDGASVAEVSTPDLVPRGVAIGAVNKAPSAIETAAVTLVEAGTSINGPTFDGM